ncbi:MAG: hypothetical protein QM811_28725 [Pirellulales bacterium]
MRGAEASGNSSSKGVADRCDDRAPDVMPPPTAGPGRTSAWTGRTF